MKLYVSEAHATPKGHRNRKAEIVCDREGLKKLRDAIDELLTRKVNWLEYGAPYEMRQGQGDRSRQHLAPAF